ncbi:MAG: hypothetical protein ACLSG8_11930 [Barnesiella sp.]
MKDKDIEQLLESFYEGTLDEQEELELLRYFESEPGNKKFAADRKIFLALHKDTFISIPKLRQETGRDNRFHGKKGD